MEEPGSNAPNQPYGKPDFWHSAFELLDSTLQHSLKIVQFAIPELAYERVLLGGAKIRYLLYWDTGRGQARLLLGRIVLPKAADDLTDVTINRTAMGDLATHFETVLRTWKADIQHDMEVVDAVRRRESDAARQQQNSTQVKPISNRRAALDRLAVMWAEYNQTDRLSKDEDMQWFLGEFANEVGLEYVSVYQFKKHLPKAYKAGIIDKDPGTGRFIPKTGNAKRTDRNS